jgi:hypothetical protein
MFFNTLIAWKSGKLLLKLTAVYLYKTSSRRKGVICQ